MRHANYQIVENPSPDHPMVIQDLGPWDKFPTVTNDVEWVVQDLIAKGLLGPHRRLFYIDSEGETDEIVHKNGAFVRFQIGPRH